VAHGASSQPWAWRPAVGSRLARTLGLTANLMQPSADLNSLAAILQYCESFSKQMLSKAGEFHPFGAFLNGETGKVDALGALTGAEKPTGVATYQLLEAFVSERTQDGSLLAYGIAANVTMPKHLNSPFPDGIRIHVEARGYSRMVYTPYRLLPLASIRRFLVVVPSVQYSEEIAVDMPPKLFAAR
jgi:hypothetical protein